jgi:hypothetical protein
MSEHKSSYGPKTRDELLRVARTKKRREERVVTFTDAERGYVYTVLLREGEPDRNSDKMLEDYFQINKYDLASLECGPSGPRLYGVHPLVRMMVPASMFSELAGAMMAAAVVEP